MISRKLMPFAALSLAIGAVALQAAPATAAGDTTQDQVDAVIAEFGGVQTAANEVSWDGGAVVLVGSQQWNNPSRDVPQLAYGASKGAGVSMMYGMAHELGAHKIRVNTVVPSWMWGPNVGLYVDWQSGVQGRSKEDIRAELDAKFALGEMATDRDVAEAVGFLLSDRARSITAQTLHVNAGEFPR